LKHALLTHSVPVVRGLHRVEEILRLADALGIAGAREMVPPMEAPFIGLPVGDYAVIHAAPMFRYKQWTQEGWRVLAQKLAASGLVVIATGGPAESERRYLDEIWMGTNVLRLDGRLSWPQLVGLLAKARVYVGPDTSVTHLAAAAGCPTIGLYGPTDPRLWGPWPKEGLEKPWTDVAPIQRRGNVWLIQHAFPCMPCQLEGCERNVRSDSHCLLSLTPETVVAVVMDALACSVECVEDPLSP
jgi:heptosyltransferase-3